ncbi:hypothetical protein V757_11200 [Pelistega indica]|uniref:Uncharacterized protein n=1 Tax=Pelistega indica TaxID=1414851 RepID=V8FV22_9BURK|nr:hypothetical protein [Pelistega indica]ETD67548.1 hypothetical protein V757_11200 [Pelistega indica]
MAKTVSLYDGGTPQFVFPAADATRRFGCRLPTQVAGEFDRGHFTLGNVLQPAAFPYQRDALAKIKAADVPVDVALLVVPELHSITQVFVHSNPTATVAGQNCCSAVTDSMQGVTFDVFAKLVDATKCGGGCSGSEDITIEQLIAEGEDFALPSGFTGIDANAEIVRHGYLDTSSSKETSVVTKIEDPLSGSTIDGAAITTTASTVFVPAGRAVVLGIRLNTAPTGTAGTFAAMQGRIALVVKVDNFEYPISK